MKGTSTRPKDQKGEKENGDKIINSQTKLKIGCAGQAEKSSVGRKKDSQNDQTTAKRRKWPKMSKPLLSRRSPQKMGKEISCQTPNSKRPGGVEEILSEEDTNNPYGVDKEVYSCFIDEQKRGDHKGSSKKGKGAQRKKGTKPPVEPWSGY